MKIYMLTQEDIELLTTMTDRNPEHGFNGGASRKLNAHEQLAYEEAHRFYNYQVRTWIQKVTK